MPCASSLAYSQQCEADHVSGFNQKILQLEKQINKKEDKNMPCSDNHQGECEREVLVNNPALTREIQVLSASNSMLGGALCALLTELECRGLYESIILTASTNGRMDIQEFWDKHKKEDYDKMRAVKDKFSKHEQDMLRRLLKEDI